MTRARCLPGLMLAVLAAGACSAEEEAVVDDPATDAGLPATRRDRPTAGDADGGVVGGGMDRAAAGDGSAASDGATGPTREACNNGLDDDLDGRVDEDCPCVPGSTQACFLGAPAAAGRGPCNRGTQACEGDGEFGNWSPCAGSGAPALEACDQQDNNCNGVIDEGCICRIGDRRRCYGAAPGTRNVGLCHDGEQACGPGVGGQAAWGACTGEVLPAPEVCDGFDNDCDGVTDDGCQCRLGATRPCYEGPAGTAAVGACHVGTQSCVPGVTAGSLWGGCDMQALPSTESCANGADDDCNGRVDCADARCAAALECRPCMTGGQRFTLTGTPADVLFVVDRSGSMNTRTPDGSTRWNALVSAVRAVLPGLDASLYMGLVIFPDPDACAVPASPVVPVVQPAAGVIASYLALRAPYSTALTPTLAALQTAERYLRATPSPRRRYVVLATDGAPNCGSTVSTVVGEIQSIRSGLGVETFVLGIPGADASLQGPLNAMADAGGRARAGATRFYEAGSASEFEAALRAITAAAASCTYRLSAAPARPDLMTVQFDGRMVDRDAANGWSYTDMTHREVRFNGAACAQLQTGVVRTVNASFNCGG